MTNITASFIAATFSDAARTANGDGRFSILSKNAAGHTIKVTADGAHNIFVWKMTATRGKLILSGTPAQVEALGLVATEEPKSFGAKMQAARSIEKAIRA